MGDQTVPDKACRDKLSEALKFDGRKGFTTKEIILPADDMSLGNCGLEKVKNKVRHVIIRLGTHWYNSLFNENDNSRKKPLDVLREIHYKIDEACLKIIEHLKPRGLWFFIVETGEIGACIAAYATDRGHTIIQLNNIGKSAVDNDLPKETKAYIFGRRIANVAEQYGAFEKNMKKIEDTATKCGGVYVS